MQKLLTNFQQKYTTTDFVSTVRLNKYLTNDFLKLTRAPHASTNARLQLLLENSKSKKVHNYDKKIEDYLPYRYGFPFESKQLV